MSSRWRTGALFASAASGTPSCANSAVVVWLCVCWPGKQADTVCTPQSSFRPIPERPARAVVPRRWPRLDARQSWRCLHDEQSSVAQRQPERDGAPENSWGHHVLQTVRLPAAVPSRRLCIADARARRRRAEAAAIFGAARQGLLCLSCMHADRLPSEERLAQYEGLRNEAASNMRLQSVRVSPKNVDSDPITHAPSLRHEPSHGCDTPVHTRKCAPEASVDSSVRGGPLPQGNHGAEPRPRNLHP